MIINNKIRVLAILTCFTLILSGCTESKLNAVQNSNNTKNTNITSKSSTTNAEKSKKEIELLPYITKNLDDIKKDFGIPAKTDDTECGRVYYYGSFYFGIDKTTGKVFSITLEGSGATVNGIGVGYLSKNIKSKIGIPLKEANDGKYTLVYKTNNNKVSIEYSSNNFSSPVNSITISDLSFGQDTPMEVTKEQVNQLMNGTWVLEKNINEKNLSLYKHIFLNGIIDTNLPEHLQKKYEVKSSNTIIIRGETLNGFGSTEKLESEFFIEFFNDSDKMEIYHLDQAGDKDSDDVYIRYN